MTQFIYHLIYLIKDTINETNSSQQPFNMTTLPEKIENNKKYKEKLEEKQCKKIDELVEATLLWSC